MIYYYYLFMIYWFNGRGNGGSDRDWPRRAGGRPPRKKTNKQVNRYYYIICVYMYICVSSFRLEFVFLPAPGPPAARRFPNSPIGVYRPVKVVLWDLTSPGT